MEPKLVEVSGKVIAKTIDLGSKSERRAVLLKTDEGVDYVLRRKDGPSFGRDEHLNALVGQSITTQGVALGETLIMREWHDRR
ncbi:hypothetical protein [Xanthobacter sp.]|uniref:hypothetical protein n=1 Tax=Xanthobacter TaxID=279 RepID=UPI0025E08327|nr:hypothetical protein [Xanthobacter sp.]